MAVDSIDAKIFERLSTFPGLTALTGSGANARWSPGILPEGVQKPAGYYEQFDVEPVSAMSTDAGVEATFWYIVTVADSYASMKAVKEQVRKAMQRWSSSTGFVVQDSFLVGSENGYAEETREHVGVLSFKIHHQTA